MKPFWRGFVKEASKVSFKRPILVVFWNKKNQHVKDYVSKAGFRFPQLKVRFINATKDPLLLKKHSVQALPTVLLLKNGREIDRIESGDKTLVEDLLRRSIT